MKIYILVALLFALAAVVVCQEGNERRQGGQSGRRNPHRQPNQNGGKRKLLNYYKNSALTSCNQIRAMKNLNIDKVL
jgi:hypothetical protein